MNREQAEYIAKEFLRLKIKINEMEIRINELEKGRRKRNKRDSKKDN